MRQRVVAVQRALEGVLRGNRGIPFAAGLAVVSAVALVVRLPLLDFKTGDFGSFLHPWYLFIQERGFADAMGEKFSDYTPPYLYMLWIAIQLPFSPVVSIKAIGLPFDFLLAAGAALVVWQCRRSPLASLATYALVLFTPTVIWNGAKWGQCDSIFAAFVLLSLFFLLRRNGAVAVLMLGVGFAFKGQAIFVLPAYLVLTWKGRIAWYSWALFPIPYLIGILPVWLLGRPFWELVKNYRDQADLYHQLVIGAPNIYQWLPSTGFLKAHGFKIAATIICIAMAVALHPRLRSGDRETVALATFFALLCPFVLPRMHDRYFFVADVLSIVYVFYLPARWFLPLLVIGASTFSYWPYLYGYADPPVEMDYLTPLILAAIATAAFDLWRMSMGTRAWSWRETLPWSREAAPVPP